MIELTNFLDKVFEWVKEQGLEKVIAIFLLLYFIAKSYFQDKFIMNKLVNSLCKIEKILEKLLNIERVKAESNPNVANSKITDIMEDKEDGIIDFKSKKGSRLEKQKQEVEA